ncbi:hypothetical protein KC727_01680 [Candidatus Kaiserbacteria bacterium]|nr:hypothetical protein [Candidatus Kaiserbacteria bacterium]
MKTLESYRVFSTVAWITTILFALFVADLAHRLEKQADAYAPTYAIDSETGN